MLTKKLVCAVRGYRKNYKVEGDIANYTEEELIAFCGECLYGTVRPSSKNCAFVTIFFW